MQKFIDRVVTQILDETSLNDLHKIKLVLPSIRSINQVKKSLLNKVDSACILPEITTINEFIISLSNRSLISSLDAQLCLIKLLKEIDSENYFKDNLFEIKQLIRDFNFIEGYVDNFDVFFKELSELVSLGSWDFNNEEDIAEKSYYKRLYFFEKLFKAFNAHLDKHQLGTYSSICREISNMKERYLQHVDMTYLIGLNALTKSEEAIFNYLCEKQSAKIIVDVDQFYVGNIDHEAGHFYRKHNNSFYNAPDKYLNSQNKEINIYQVETYEQQLDLASQLVQKNSNEIAVINMDEDFSPMLYKNLVSSKNEVNFSSGIPISFFESFKLFQFLIQTILTSNKLEKLTFDWLAELLSFSVFNEHSNNIIHAETLFKKRNEFELNFNSVYKTLPDLKGILHAFGNINKESNLLLKTVELVHEIEKLYDGDEKELSVIKIILQELDKLMNYINKNQSQLTTKQTLSILSDQINIKKIATIGNADDKVQLIGLLESRIIDYENVIFTSFNEDFIPGKKAIETIIPYEMKKKYGIPTNFEKDALYAYYFYRTLHYPNKVHIIHLVGENKGLKSNEPSRFIHQINHEFSDNKQINISIHSENQKLITIDNTIKKAEKDLETLKKWMEYGISYSAINTYLKCSLDFYFKYIIGVKENQSPSKFLEPSEWGTAVHNTLEKLFDSHKNIDETSLKRIINEVEDCQQEEFKLMFHDKRHLTGKNKIKYYQFQQYIKNYLKKELHNIKRTGSYRVLSNEETLNYTDELFINNQKSLCHFNGKIDRIDETANGIRLIDYKTGFVSQDNLSISNISSVRSKDKALQLFFYGLLYSKNNPDCDKISASIVTLNNTVNPTQNLKFNKSLTISSTDISSFREELILIIQEICNTETPIFHQPESKYCQFC